MFHDGEKVRAQDAVASIGRWIKHNTVRQKLESVTDELSAHEDRSIIFRLKRPFPLLLAALANPANPAFVLPERLARTDPYTPIKDATGSGPFRFKADEFNSGSFTAYERNAAYRPVASGEPSLTAGPKIVHFDRVEWQTIPDPATAAAALQKGEVDWYASPTPEQIDVLGRNPAIKILPRNFAGNGGILRFNHLHSPFDNQALRQALLPAIVQADFMRAIVADDASAFQVDTGVFPPSLPCATTVGLEPLRSTTWICCPASRRSLQRRQLMRLWWARTCRRATLWARWRLICSGGWASIWTSPRPTGRPCFAAEHRGPLKRGGWSVFLTTTRVRSGRPEAHVAIRGNGRAAWPGWPQPEVGAVA